MEEEVDLVDFHLGVLPMATGMDVTADEAATVVVAMALLLKKNDPSLRRVNEPKVRPRRPVESPESILEVPAAAEAPTFAVDHLVEEDVTDGQVEEVILLLRMQALST